MEKDYLLKSLMMIIYCLNQNNIDNFEFHIKVYFFK